MRAIVSELVATLKLRVVLILKKGLGQSPILTINHDEKPIKAIVASPSEQ